MAQAAQAPAEESDADVGIVPSSQASPPPDQSAAAPADGEEGRQIVVRPRPAPKPPPKPIAPHPSVPVAVAPNVAAPVAVGQKPPAPAEESDADVGIVPSQPSAVSAPKQKPPTPPQPPQPETDEQVGIQKWPGWGPEIRKSVQGGLAEGVEGLAGLPHDIPKGIDYGLDWAGAHLAQAIGGPPAEETLKASQGSALRELGLGHLVDAFGQIPIPGGADYQRWFKKAGIDPGYQPQSAAGRYAHEIAAFAPAALATIPFGGAGMAAKILPRLGETIAPAVGSETLGDAAQGTSLEPWARVAGAGLGGFGQLAARQGVTAATDWMAPATKGGQEDLAAAQFRAQTQDPAAALGNIRAAQAQRQPGMATGEVIPGSLPTTAQVTGDLRNVGAERAAQIADPEGHAARMTQQRAAQSQALQGVQSTGSPETVSDMITKRLQDIDAQHEAEVGLHQGIHAAGQQSLEEQARTAAGQVARKGEPEALGEAARKPLVESMAKAKEQETRLWQSIQADKIGVWTNQVGARARDVAKKMGLQKPMGGEESAIFNAAGSLPRWTKLSDLTDLSQRIKAEMRNERFTNGNTPALKRMTQLNKTMENVIKNAATRQSAKEAQSTMEGLRRMTPEDRADIMKARAATRARGEIERGPAGAIIRKGAGAEDYRTMSSQVPGKVFAAGPTGYQKLKAYTEALGKPYLDPVHDIVSDSLAREATTDGMVDAGKLQRWQAKYSDALRALPDDIRQKFVSGPNEANEALAEGAAARREALIAHSKLDVAKEMGKSPAVAMRADPAFKGLEGLTNPRDVQKTIGGLFERKDAVDTIGRLARTVASNPNAAEGLKRAVLDHVIEKVTSMAEAGTTGVKALKPGTTQTYIRNNRAALKAAGLSDSQLGTLDRIGADIERQQRFYATKAAGQSNTPQDLFKHLKEASEAPHNSGLLGKVMAVKESIEGAHRLGIPHAVSIPAGIAGYIGSRLFGSARNAGLKNVADIVHDAVMNPDRAAQLLSHTPKIIDRGSQATLANSWKRQAMYAGLAGERPMVLNRGQ